MPMDDGDWQAAPAEIIPSEGRIDVWRVEIDGENPPDSDIKSLLSEDETARASRFHFERHSSRYIRGRASLRILLGRYLQTAPGEIRFKYENNGKPEIECPARGKDLCFNVSNSDGLALIALCCGTPLGVDIEKLREMRDLLAIARRFFSAHEVKDILAISEARRPEAFFTCWTRKEAFLKATGVGLSYPLSDFSVSLDPDGPAELLEIKGSRKLAHHWYLTDLVPAAGFRGALACQTKNLKVAKWSFSPAPATAQG